MIIEIQCQIPSYDSIFKSLEQVFDALQNRYSALTHGQQSKLYIEQIGKIVDSAIPKNNSFLAQYSSSSWTYGLTKRTCFYMDININAIPIEITQEFNDYCKENNIIYNATIKTPLFLLTYSPKFSKLLFERSFDNPSYAHLNHSMNYFIYYNYLYDSGPHRISKSKYDYVVTLCNSISSKEDLEYLAFHIKMYLLSLMYYSPEFISVQKV